MEIIWSEPSLERLEEIGHFIAKDSPLKARNFIDKLISAVERLQDFPLSGGFVPENTAFRQIVIQGYRIIYRPQDKRIEIITVISPGLGEKF